MIIAMQMIKEGKNNGSGGCTGKGRIKGRSFLLGANRLNLEEEHFRLRERLGQDGNQSASSKDSMGDRQGCQGGGWAFPGEGPA